MVIADKETDETILVRYNVRYNEMLEITSKNINSEGIIDN